MDGSLIEARRLVGNARCSWCASSFVRTPLETVERLRAPGMGLSIPFGRSPNAPSPRSPQHYDAANWRGEAGPADKIVMLDMAEGHGPPTLMVGDGLNDAP